MPRYSEENFPHILTLVDMLKSLAVKKDCTAAQLTIAWLMARGHDIIPIPGTRSIKYLEENVGALKVRLSANEEGEISNAVMKTELQGDRYPKG
jgi:aryl-alcohol dehydrogenase-like predicted oxidoreductase